MDNKTMIKVYTKEFERCIDQAATIGACMQYGIDVEQGEQDRDFFLALAKECRTVVLQAKDWQEHDECQARIDRLVALGKPTQWK